MRSKGEESDTDPYTARIWFRIRSVYGSGGGFEEGRLFDRRVADHDSDVPEPIHPPVRYLIPLEFQ